MRVNCNWHSKDANPFYSENNLKNGFSLSIDEQDRTEIHITFYKPEYWDGVYNPCCLEKVNSLKNFPSILD